MNFTQSFKLAIKSLLLSKMRALLTMLGIIIGVAAVIIITSLGNGMQNYMNAQFEQLGSNLIQVMVYGRGEGGTRDVNTEDMYALVEKYPQYLSGVTPYVSATTSSVPRMSPKSRSCRRSSRSGFTAPPRRWRSVSASSISSSPFFCIPLLQRMIPVMAPISPRC